MPMATADALTGVGVPAQLATLLGGNPNKQAGTGTAQTGATVIRSRNTELNPQASATAFVFPSTAGVMEPYFLVNPQSTSALIFVPSGHTLSTVSSGGSNGNVTLAQNTSVVMWQYKPKFWAANLSTVA